MKIRRTLLAALLLLPACAPRAAVTGAGAPDPMLARAERILASAPLVDGHNDLVDAGGTAPGVDLTVPNPRLHTDIPRLRRGRVGAQFWSAWVSPDSARPREEALRMIAAARSLADRYEALEAALTADDIVRIHREGRIASLVGVEGGASIENSLETLRAFHELGVRYLTLTHNRNTDWADAAADSARHGGLAPFGEQVVREMNRLGMFVDLSHVSPGTMRDALAVSAAPVIFSHSSARALVDHPRNVPDDVLRLLRANGGVAMVNFYPEFVSVEVMRWAAARAAIPQERRREWEAANPRPSATLAQVADHVDHIRRVAGIDHVGIGSDFDGISSVPVGLEDVSTYPALFAELLRRGYSEGDLRKIAGQNLLRAMRRMEGVAERLRREER